MIATATTMAPSINEDPMSTWMLLNGSATANATTLDATSLQPFVSNAPPVGAANVTKHFIINETDIVTWVMDGYPYKEPVMPILYGNTSDGWLANTTIQLPINSTIDIILMIANDSMDTVRLCPMLHYCVNDTDYHVNRWATRYICMATSFGSWALVLGTFLMHRCATHPRV